MHWRRSEAVALTDPPVVPPRWWGLSRRQWSDLLYIMMMSVGWMAGNILGLLGCVVAVFLIIAHGDFAVFMAHVDNIAARYLAADLGRRARFEHQLLIALAIAGAVFFVIRLPRFVARLRLELAQEHQP